LNRLCNEIITYLEKINEYSMEKRMEAVTVYVSDTKNVCIKGDEYDGVESVIVLNPNQIDTIIQWLKEAKSEALQDKNSSTPE